MQYMNNITDYTKYDFIDFGASKGGSIDFAKIFLGGKRGVGIDIDQKKIDMMIKSGYECEYGDITNLVNIPDNTVKFVMMSHVLEHLNSLEDIYKAIQEAIRISTDFVYIQGPNFDDDEYLHRNNLRFFWSFWKGHTYHFQSSELISILEKCSGFKESIIAYRGPLYSSTSSCIHSLDSPIDQHEYDPSVHPPKTSIRFDNTLYKEIVAVIRIDNKINAEKIITCRGKVVDVTTGKSYGKIKVTEVIKVILKVIRSGQFFNYFKKLIK